jgi:hypothetical protein
MTDSEERERAKFEHRSAVLEFTRNMGFGAKFKRFGAGDGDRASWRGYHWVVELSYDGRTFSCDFTQGEAHRGKSRKSPLDVVVPENERTGIRHYAHAPTLEGVLTCLQSDASAPDTFEEFADEFGYDRDSRKAEAVWRSCRETRLKLLDLFGGRKFAQFIETQFDY